MYEYIVYARMIYILLGSFVVIETTTTKSIKITLPRRHFENSTTHTLASAILKKNMRTKFKERDYRFWLPF